MNIIEQFEEAKNKLYEHVGFVEDWVVYPIDIRTEYFWIVNEKEKYVRYADSISVLYSDGNYYENEIYTQRFYSKHVYRGEKYTMIFVDTHVDGNKFFAFFDNEREQKNDF